MLHVLWDWRIALWNVKEHWRLRLEQARSGGVDRRLVGDDSPAGRRFGWWTEGAGVALGRLSRRWSRRRTVRLMAALGVALLAYALFLVIGAGRASAAVSTPQTSGIAMTDNRTGLAWRPADARAGDGQLVALPRVSTLPSVGRQAVVAVAAARTPRSGQVLPEPEDPGETAELPVVINNATEWLRGIVVVVATCTLTLAGLFYLMARDPQSVDRAKSFAGAAVAGYALALLAPQILTVVQSILGVG
ncbi:pilin [Kineosporia sp. NBRC 101677]|uniref:pilin n=1 Tax=Kineosporia sp. NBRC 101677 TaxID=3032197 RepID=UPI002553BC8E|nr:pilin [Kineosporia sp. NBRC 101677]